MEKADCCNKPLGTVDRKQINPKEKSAKLNTRAGLYVAEKPYVNNRAGIISCKLKWCLSWGNAPALSGPSYVETDADK